MSVLLAVITGTTIWVFYDAKSIGVKKGMVKGIADMDPGEWLVGLILCWLLVFPLYLWNRSKFKRAANASDDEMKS